MLYGHHIHQRVIIKYCLNFINFIIYFQVFACAVLDRVYVYDLNIDKHGKLAEQKPAKSPKLTNLAFN